jgi:acrylyl-CoA reductase (NADPH)
MGIKMTTETFKALVLRQQDEKTISAIEQLTVNDLPDADVLVAVDYSSLNYKDALAVSGTGMIVRTWPMVPGIDLAGTVLESESTQYKPGDKVVLTGWGVGEKYWGGYTQQQRVKSEWLVPLPDGLDTKLAMAIGTAGFTAMLCVMALEDAGITPDRGSVVVSGAAGGVGSVAVAILAKLGYRVTAVTGRESTHAYLRDLGASDIISREEMAAKSRPLEKQRWAGGIDTVGDTVLARMLAETDYDGAVAACGLAGGYKLPTSVMPFILRNVRLQGVDSVMCPPARRQQAWQRIVEDLPHSLLGQINQVATLEEIPQLATEMMAGQIKGRVVVDVNA